MKKIQILSILLLVPVCTLMGQAQLLNLNLSKPGEPVMYVGVVNSIMFQGAYEGKNLRFESAKGKIEVKTGTSMRADLTYLRPDTDTLRFYVDSVLVIEKVYRVDTLCAADIRLRNTEKSEVTTDEILKAAKIEATYPNCLYRWRGRVQNWSYQILRKGKAIDEEKTSKLNAFDEPIRKVFEALQPGDELIFKVTEISNGGNVFRPTSKKYTIKAK